MSGKRSTFLGKVKISGTTFPKTGSESLVYYPLEKRSVFSVIKGEIGLKVWFVDEEPVPLPPTEGEKKVEAVTETNAEEKKLDEAKTGEEEKAKTTEEVKKEDAGTDAKEASKPEEAKVEEAATTTTPVPVVENPPPVAEKPKAVMEKRVNLNATDLDLRRLGSDRGRTAYDLVDPMPFLFVRVLKAKRGDKDEADGSVYAKLVIGTHSVNTRKQSDNKDWDQVFAFDKEGLNSTSLEVSVCVEKKGADDSLIETSLGTVSFDLLEVPKRVPPDSPLAPQWYTLDCGTTDVMLAVWIGTQVDEAFQEAWQSDSGGLVPETLHVWQASKCKNDVLCLKFNITTQLKRNHN